MQSDRINLSFQYSIAIVKLTLPRLNALSIHTGYYYLDLVIELSFSNI